MTKIQVGKDKIVIISSEHYIEKTKNAYNLNVEFSSEWYGLEKRMVFKTDHCEEVITTQSQTLTFAMPTKIFSEPSTKLLIGVYGYRGCELVLNTKFAKLGKVEKGVNPDTPNTSVSEAIAGIPPGGMINQVLSKKSDADGDVYWRDAITSIFLSAPIGTIVAYTGKIEDIPASYGLCDGRNGTPDLRNAFIIGAGGYYDPGDTNKLQIQDPPTRTDYDPIEPDTSDIGFYSLCFIQKLYLTDLDKKESMTAYEIALQQGFQGDEKAWLASLQGKSAYQIAVDNGFEGTESEWLDSLGQELPKVEDVTIMTKDEFPVTASGCYLFRDVHFVSPGVSRANTYTNFQNEIVYINVEDPDFAKITNINNDVFTISYNEDGRIQAIELESIIEQILNTVQTIQGEPGKSAYQVALDNGFKGSETEWLVSLQGPAGKEGPRGKDGAEGPAGKDGKQGRDGTPGEDGLSAYQVAIKNGFTGSEQQWLTSLKGADGQNGSRGPQGLPGNDGATGPAGADGKSAYQIAVAHGFRGTESEWVESLKGADGLNGKDGKDGIDGAVGPEGKRGLAGASAYQIAVENGFTGSETEWLESLKGANGKNGRDGTDGLDGQSAYQIAVENGFNGSEQVWLASLHGSDGQDGTDGKNGLSAYELAVKNGYEGTTTEWLQSLHGKDGRSAYEIAVEQGFTGTKDEWLSTIMQDMTGVYRYKGSVASYETLPTDNLTMGDVYNVVDTGMNYAWDGDAWDPLGSTLKVEAIDTNAIDSILAGGDPVNYDANSFLNPVGLAHLKDKLNGSSSTPTGGITKEEADARYLQLSGGDVTGPVMFYQDETQTTEAYVRIDPLETKIGSDVLRLLGNYGINFYTETVNFYQNEEHVTEPIVGIDPSRTMINADEIILSGNSITLSGDSIYFEPSSREVDARGAKLTNLGTPEYDYDAATVEYVNMGIDSVTNNIDSVYNFAQEEVQKLQDAINELPKEIYSTDEQIIGNWIDGTNLYRITFSGVVDDDGNFPSPVATLSDVGTIVSVTGGVNAILANQGGYTGWVPIPYYYGFAGCIYYDIMHADYIADGYDIYIAEVPTTTEDMMPVLNGQKFHITVTYTKASESEEEGGGEESGPPTPPDPPDLPDPPDPEGGGED